ncbi:hypothetical protein TSAR_005128 [Trichomalopsis sarcophagae]|uniref:Uncharacterized protein n=1 Tax=Trichomalopsis sarcophagae TaxID=543379 RepID=A0A232EZA9_9HYME|nr:hypothetical protein TSAR_005128 [Trichomalopsis sarcophagae]
MFACLLYNPISPHEYFYIRPASLVGDSKQSFLKEKKEACMLPSLFPNKDCITQQISFSSINIVLFTKSKYYFPTNLFADSIPKLFVDRNNY